MGVAPCNPAVRHTVFTESILPCLLYIPSVAPHSFRERAPRHCLEATVLRNDGLGRGSMQAEGGVAEHCSVAWLMGTCIIFLEGLASEGHNVVYRQCTLKGPAAQEKGTLFNGHSVTLNHDLLFKSVCISLWQRPRRTLADVQAALQHWLLDGFPNSPCSPPQTSEQLACL